jgi:hypothetical protein
MQLTKTSFRVLRQDMALLWLPVLSGLAAIGLIALVAGSLASVAFLVPGGSSFLFGSLGGLVLVGALWVALYFALAFVGTFFLAALVGAATLKLNGGQPTVGDGIAIARARIRKLLLWALFATTVGLLIQLVASRFGGVVSLLLRLGAGLSWAVATYFVVPVILYEELPTFGSLKRSASLFAGAFGRLLLSNLVLGLLTFGLVVLGIVPLVAGVLLLFGGSPAVGVALLVLGLAILVFAAVLVSAVSGVLRAALYRYATTGQITPGLLPAGLAGPSLPGAPLPSASPGFFPPR